MIGDALDDMPKVRLRIEADQFCRADQAVDCGGAITARIRSREEIIFASEGDRAQRALGAVVIDFDQTVGGKARERLPARQCIADCDCKIGFR